MGGENPIRIQSMTNTSTMDTEGSIQQCIRIVEAGGEYVRLTAQGVREAENLQNIKAGLRERGYLVPLVADIHFNPKAAEVAARIVEKVRINPGNFADPVKTFKTFEYSEAEYEQELIKIKERFVPFLDICKEHNTAIRIGVNHGSLSDRIMSRYGDTPQGMVESCMEFLKICVSEDFHNVVISIKASNTLVMVRTVRLLVAQMEKENMSFPLHLGVTEAGDGEDGRIKSAVGIGTLLLEGIGDTIRVSLSEDPEAEIPVAQSLVKHVQNTPTSSSLTSIPIAEQYNPFDPARRKTNPVGIIGGENVPVVISNRSTCESKDFNPDLIPDFVCVGKQLSDSSGENKYPLFTIEEKDAWLTCEEDLQFISLNYDELNDEILNHLKDKHQTVILIHPAKQDSIYEQKAFIHVLMNAGVKNPVVLCKTYNESDLESFQIKSATDAGSFFLDSLADGIMLDNSNPKVAHN